MKNGRIAWVDTLRFLGMLAVYIGHFGEIGGRLYPFVFIYHVPLFFFAAGFFARKDEPLPLMAWRYTRRLLAPYIFFALLYAVTLALFYDWPWTKLQDALVAFSFGIRNQIPAGSLWFLPCLFVVALAYGAVLRLTRSALAGLAFGGICLTVSQVGLPFDPLAAPSWPLNADSALYYVWWYALGQAAFPFLRSEVRRPWFTVVGILAALATGWFYFNGTGEIYALADIFPPGRRQNFTHAVIGVLIIGVAILANIAFAHALESVQLLREMGQRTLTLCGTEDFTKLVLGQTLLLFGLKFQMIHPLSVVLYAFSCMLFSTLIIGRALENHAPQWTSLRTRSVSGPILR